MPDRVRDLLVDPTCDGMRLDAFLATGDGMPSRSACARLVEEGAVLINSTDAGSKSERVMLGDRIRVTLPHADAVEPFSRICEASPLPVVADIHFDHRLAIAAAKANTALSYTVALRDKFLEAYKELMQIQV